MDGDFLTGGYSKKHTLETLEKRRNELHDELHGMYEHTRGLSKADLEKELQEIEVQIQLLSDTPEPEQ